MKYLTNLAATMFLITSLSGCIVIGGDHDWDDNNWRSKQLQNREIISNLQIGTERGQVLSLLGAPNFSEAFIKDDAEIRVLYFRTQHRHADGDTSKDETTPLVFKNDKLIGWGEDTLATVR